MPPDPHRVDPAPIDITPPEGEVIRQNPPVAWREILLGLAMLAFTLLLVKATQIIPVSTYAKVGPAVFPWAITIGFGVTALLVLVQALRGGWVEPEACQTNFKGLGLMCLGLVLNLVLIAGLSYGDRVIVPAFGFILSSSVLFLFTARAFGSFQPMRDALVGFMLALGAYIAFDRLLGYRIGSGIVERFL